MHLLSLLMLLLSFFCYYILQFSQNVSLHCSDTVVGQRKATTPTVPKSLHSGTSFNLE